MVPEPLREPRPSGFPDVPGYAIESVIGRGATGVVYRAKQLAVDRVVALKVLHPELAARGKAVRRLQREARTTARLAHPNIVTAIDMGETHGLWWYAMELVDGPSLAERLHKEGRLSERVALRLFIPLCEALEHAHEAGVVHRDIKPANILVDSTGRARLVDLGLAFAEDDPLLTSPGGTLGTPHYVSPEQARNPQSADVRSDIWSFGATLFHALCGRPPFGSWGNRSSERSDDRSNEQGGDSELASASESAGASASSPGASGSVAEVLSGVLYGRVPDPGELEPSLSKGMQLVLRKCLSRDPERRYADPRELREDLERIRERRQVAVRRAALDPVQRERDPRKRIAIAAGALLLAGACALAILQPWRDPPDETPLASAPSFYEPLEQIEDEAARGRKFLAKAINDLKRLQAEVPPRYEQRFKEVSADVHRLYNEAVADVRKSLHQELARLQTEERDYVAALRLIDSDLEPRLRRELNPSPDQLADLYDRLDVPEKRRALDLDLERAVKALGEQLSEHYWSVVLRRVENLREQESWRSARAELQKSVHERLAEAQISTRGLPEDRVEALVAGAANMLVKPKTNELELGWQGKDAELERFVLARADELERELLERKALSNPEHELAISFARELAAQRLRPEEFLADVSDQARATLARRGRELAALEARLLAADAEQLFLEKLASLAPLWTKRDYAGLRREWQETLERPYMEPMRAQIELEQQEAELLEGLLERAAAKIARIRPEDPPVRLLVGTIVREGRVDPGSDPLNKGFRLLPRDGGSALWLALRELDDPRAQKLGADAVETLAELAPDASDPLERLIRALFRWREGDVRAAAQMLPIVPLPRDDLARLVADFGVRVADAVSEEDVAVRDRAQKAENLYYLINREASATSGKTDGTLRRIDELLGGYGDLEFVREREDRLKELKRELSLPPAPVTQRDFERLFRPTHVRLETSRVSLSFDFSAADSGWSRGDWIASGESWQAPGLRTPAQLLDDKLWPTLELRPPIELEKTLEVELSIQQPQDSPPRFLIVSVAGIHVAFASPSELGRVGRWRVSSGGPAELAQLVTEVLDGEQGEHFPGLQRGANHTLRIELSQTRGKADVFLDGALLGWKEALRPERKPGASNVVVRSLEPVRLLEARVIARYR